MVSRAGVRRFLTEGRPDPRGWPDAELLAHGQLGSPIGGHL